MLVVEKQLPSKETEGVTAQYKILTWIKYLKLLKKRVYGRQASNKVLVSLREKVDIKTNSSDKKELVSLIQEVWEDWRQVKANKIELHKKELYEKLYESSKHDEEEKTKAIKRIKHVKQVGMLHSQKNPTSSWIQER